MNQFTRELRNRIYEDAPEDKVRGLQIDDHYGSPQSFFASALHLGLINESEYERARLAHGTLWNYRGD